METNIFEICDEIIWIEPDSIDAILYPPDTTTYSHLTFLPTIHGESKG